MKRPQSGAQGRKWRRMQCLGKCQTTGGWQEGGDVHQSITKNTWWYVETWSRDGRPTLDGKTFTTEAAAKRAVERWLASRSSGATRRRK